MSETEIRRYRVAASRRVFGFEPGETFERVIPPIQEARLLRSGAIEEVRPKRKQAKKRSKKSASAPAPAKADTKPSAADAAGDNQEPQGSVDDKEQ